MNFTEFEFRNASAVLLRPPLESVNLTSWVNISPFPFGFRLLLHVLYNLVLICGVVGNTLVLYVIYSLPRMRTTTNILLANLAVGDLLISSFSLPFTYISIIYGYWPFGHVLCKVVPTLSAAGVLNVAFTLIALASEKYIAILHPLSPRLRKSKVIWVITIIWMIAWGIASPIAIVSKVQVQVHPNFSAVPTCEEFGWTNVEQELIYSISLMMVQYFIPLIVLVYTYTRISCVVWGIHHEWPSVVMTGSKGGSSQISLNRSSRGATDNSRSRKAVLLTLAVVMGYTLAWLPYNLDYILRCYNQDWSNIHVSIACHWLAMSHCFYNPIIYAWINNSFRNAFKDVYQKIICCQKKSEMSSRNFGNAGGSFSTSLSMSTIRSKSYRKNSVSQRVHRDSKKKNVGSMRNEPLLFDAIQEEI